MTTAKEIRELHEKSVIFDDSDRTPLNNRFLASAVKSSGGKTRENKTFQDSNIFVLHIDFHFINDFT